MAWACSASSNKALVANLVKNGLIRSQQVADAMNLVDRGRYTAEAAAKWTHTGTDEGLLHSRQDAYIDAPIEIGPGVTCSAPHMHAYALEALLPYVVPGETHSDFNSRKVLDIGSGSGYLTACLSALAGDKAKVVGVEHSSMLVERSREAIERDTSSHSDCNAGWIKEGRIEIREGDGRLGYVKEAPYDAIHVGAAASTIPQALIDQLKAPGRMFIPVGTMEQSIIQVDKSVDGIITKSKVMSVRYVPLTDKST